MVDFCKSDLQVDVSPEVAESLTVFECNDLLNYVRMLRCKEDSEYSKEPAVLLRLRKLAKAAELEDGQNES